MSQDHEQSPSIAEPGETGLPETGLPETRVPETGAPETGLPAVDDALAELSTLDDQPVSEHHERLSSAHDALHDALQAPTGANDS